MKRNITKKTLEFDICIFNQERIKKQTKYILYDLFNYIPKLNQIIKLNLQIKIFYEMMNNITN